MRFVRTSCYCACVRITCFFLSGMISKFLHAAPVMSMRCQFSGIRCALRCLTEAVPLFNLRGSKVQVVNKLGWFVQIQSLCACSRTPKNVMHSPTSITSFCRSVLAPASSSSETMSVLHNMAANISAECPYCVMWQTCVYSETLMNGSSHTVITCYRMW